MSAKVSEVHSALLAAIKSSRATMRGTAAFLAERKKTLMQVITKTSGKTSQMSWAAANGRARTQAARKQSAAITVARWSHRSTSVPASGATMRLGTAATRNTVAVAS